MDQPISLYLDLEPGEVADLEAVARASLAFAAALKEAAYILDPSLDVRIGFQSGTEGSLSINSVITSLRKALPHDRPTLMAMLFMALGWFGADVRSYYVGKGLDHVLGAEQLSDADVTRIASELDRLQKAHVGERQVREVYAALKDDKAVRAVGATPQPSTRPPQLVPKSEFDGRSREALPTTKTIQKRSRDDKVRVTLIAPVLLPRERSWKLWLPSLGEFGAKMRDEKFLDRVANGQLKIPLQAGVQMDVILTTNEENEGEVWAVKERIIKQVIRTRKPTNASTTDLLSALEKGKSDDD